MSEVEEKDLIFASELGDWEYCRRAWWYSKIKHNKSANVEALERGTQAHSAFGGQVYAIGWLQFLAIVLIFVALAWLVLFLIRG